jgi:hypothetical protein
MRQSLQTTVPSLRLGTRERENERIGGIVQKEAEPPDHRSQPEAGNERTPRKGIIEV